MRTELQILANTSDDELRTHIKIRHPQWSDELIEKEIENLRSKRFEEWCENLIEERE